MKKEDFLLLLNRYLSGDTNLEENNKLLNYYESFQTDKDWDESLGSKDELEFKMRTRLQNAIQSEETQVMSIQPFYTKTAFKLTAMAA